MVFLLHVGRLPLAISRIVSRNRILCEAAADDLKTAFLLHTCVSLPDLIWFIAALFKAGCGWAANGVSLFSALVTTALSDQSVFHLLLAVAWAFHLLQTCKRRVNVLSLLFALLKIFSISLVSFCLTYFETDDAYDWRDIDFLLKYLLIDSLVRHLRRRITFWNNIMFYELFSVPQTPNGWRVGNICWTTVIVMNGRLVNRKCPLPSLPELWLYPLTAILSTTSIKHTVYMLWCNNCHYEDLLIQTLKKVTKTTSARFHNQLVQFSLLFGKLTKKAHEDK